MDKKVLVVSGITGAGKSDLAIKIALELGGEIVNCDSVQLYQDVRIGSAMPSDEDFQKVPHHLFEILPPDQEIDCVRYSKLADQKIEEIIAQNKLPIIVGGSGLYLQSLLMGLVERPEIKVEYEKDFRTKRGLVYEQQTGEKEAELFNRHNYGAPRYTALVLLLAPPKEITYPKIEKRAEQMLEQGLIEETKALIEQYAPAPRVTDAIGFRHCKDFLSGTFSKEELLETLKRDTRRYAKRQYTWWRNQPSKFRWEKITKDELSISELKDLFNNNSKITLVEVLNISFSSQSNS